MERRVVWALFTSLTRRSTPGSGITIKWTERAFILGLMERVIMGNLYEDSFMVME